MRARLLLLLLIPMALASPRTAGAAGIPDPGHSAVDPCLIVCPAGDFTFQVTVRDIVGQPIGNAQVLVNLCECSDVHPCPGTPCDVLGVTNAAGNVVFQIKAGGVCPAGSSVSIRADGVLLASRPVASPDQNGDLFVDAADVAVAVGKIGSGNASADLDCDGAVTPADVTIVGNHQEHMCNAVPTLPSSWGRVKATYR